MSKIKSHNSRTFPADKMFPKTGYAYAAWADGIPTTETLRKLRKKQHGRKSRQYLKNDLKQQLVNNDE